MSFFGKVIHFGYTLAHVAKDGKVTPDELIDVMKLIFPDHIDVALEQVRGQLDDDGTVGVDDVLKIVTALI